MFIFTCVSLLYIDTIWLHGLSSFQAGDTKLERFMPKNQHTQRKLVNFIICVCGAVKNWTSF